MKPTIAYALAAVMTVSAAPFPQTSGLDGHTNALEARYNDPLKEIPLEFVCRNPYFKNEPMCEDFKPKAKKTKGTLIKRDDSVEAWRNPSVDLYRGIICRDPKNKKSPLCANRKTKPKPNKGKWSILKRNDTVKAREEPKANIENLDRMIWRTEPFDADGNSKHKRDMASAERAPSNKAKMCIADRGYQNKNRAFCIKAICDLPTFPGKTKLCRAMKKGGKKSVDFRLAVRQDEASEAGMDTVGAEGPEGEDAMEKRDEEPSDTESSFGQGQGSGQGQGQGQGRGQGNIVKRDEAGRKLGSVGSNVGGSVKRSEEPENQAEEMEKRDEEPSDTESSFGQGQGSGQGQGQGQGRGQGNIVKRDEAGRKLGSVGANVGGSVKRSTEPEDEDEAEEMKKRDEAGRKLGSVGSNVGGSI
ncbi:hypothetical protein CDD80_4641 [Ophiocordyceps camponoti-rufipedis]|uniref:Uncharacterized protein n=1 Tax=Ophiocordyceps camponoti-rufipedis TaxID=2004952 RepID=A0A2C5YXP7_9HYPO|nr:hypothetical protein CDD80_4641 [Ophiocordyceps camponoti-rufipedis]